LIPAPGEAEGGRRSTARRATAAAAFALVLALSPVFGQGGAEANIRKVVAAAREQIGVTVIYDGSYRRLAYPGGDVPMERGVCTDVLIRAFRGAGVDLQVLVHEDMARTFDEYPHVWGLSRPDANIDHRRVPNLVVFFRRHGRSLRPSADPRDYLPGDIVVWRLPSGVPHIGLVSPARAPGTDRPLVIHNIGQGTREEDVLFAYDITGHFRYFV
jgi:uncharacterized protein YijF (DUF1287 family)